MKTRNIIWLGSIVVFLPAVYHGLTVLAGFAVAAFFYELGKISGAIDQSLRSEESADGSAKDTPVLVEDE